MGACYDWLVYVPPCSAFSTTPIYPRPSSAPHPLLPSPCCHWWTRHGQSWPSFHLPTQRATTSSGRLRLVLGKHCKVGVTKCYCGCGQVLLWVWPDVVGVVRLISMWLSCTINQRIAEAEDIQPSTSWSLTTNATFSTCPLLVRGHSLVSVLQATESWVGPGSGAILDRYC